MAKGQTVTSKLVAAVLLAWSVSPSGDNWRLLVCWSTNWIEPLNELFSIATKRWRWKHFTSQRHLLATIENNWLSILTFSRNWWSIGCVICGYMLLPLLLPQTFEVDFVIDPFNPACRLRITIDQNQSVHHGRTPPSQSNQYIGTQTWSETNTVGYPKIMHDIFNLKEKHSFFLKYSVISRVKIKSACFFEKNATFHLRKKVSLKKNPGAEIQRAISIIRSFLLERSFHSFKIILLRTWYGLT